jgi:hypothetical protein
MHISKREYTNKNVRRGETHHIEGLPFSCLNRFVDPRRQLKAFFLFRSSKKMFYCVPTTFQEQIIYYVSNWFKSIYSYNSRFVVRIGQLQTI